MAPKKKLEIGDTFSEGKLKYIVIGYDAENRPVSRIAKEEDRPVRRTRNKEENKDGEE